MVVLLKRVCPNKHLLFGTFFDTQKVGSDEAQRGMAAMSKAIGVNPWCAICGSRDLKTEEEPTEFLTMKDAAAHIAGKVHAEAELREKFKSSGTMFDQKGN